MNEIIGVVIPKGNTSLNISLLRLGWASHLIHHFHIDWSSHMDIAHQKTESINSMQIAQGVLSDMNVSHGSGIYLTSAKHFVLDSSGQSHTDPQSPQLSPFWTGLSRHTFSVGSCPALSRYTQL